jgi:hypothetical protein
MRTATALVAASTETLPIILLPSVFVSHLGARIQSSQFMLRPFPRSGLDHPQESLVSARQTSPSTLQRAKALSHPSALLSAATEAAVRLIRAKAAAMPEGNFIVSMLPTFCDRCTKIETARGEIMRLGKERNHRVFEGLNVQEGKTISFQSLFRSKNVSDDIWAGRLIHGIG